MNNSTKTTRTPLWISIFFFAIYFANIIVGKLSLVFTSSTLPISLPVTVEFILLALACIFFVIEILFIEERESQ
jgi:hypothetical protein